MNKFFKSLALLGAGLFFTVAHSQNTDYFKNYKKLGLNVEYGVGFTTNETNPGMDFYLRNVRIPSLGLTYNFYQNQNWNFNVKTNIRLYNHAINVYIPRESLDSEFDFDLGTRVEHGYFDINTQISAERIFSINEKYALRTGFGLSTLFYPKDRSYGPGGIGIGGEQILSYDWRTGNRDFYFGAALSAGVDIKTRDFLYRWSLNYQHNFSGAQDFYDVRTFNLVDHPETLAKKKHMGHYLSLGLAVHPSQYLFTKKTKAEKQENKKTFVRNIFKEYSPLAISVGLDYLWDSWDTRSQRDYTNIDFNSFTYAKNIGLHYSYFNPGRFSFRAGVNYRGVSKNLCVALPSHVTGFENDVTLRPRLNDVHHIGFSHYFDFYSRLNDKTNFITTMGARVEKAFSKEKEFRYFPTENSSVVYIRDYTYFEEDPLLHALIGFGVERKTNNFMYRLDVNYQLNLLFQNQETYVGVQNVQTQQISRAEHSYGFGSIGMSLLIRPNKNLFKRK